MERPIAPIKIPEAPTPYRSTRFANGMLMVVLFFPLAIIFWEIDQPLRRQFCPPATFMSGTLQPNWEICSIFAAMSLTWFVRYWLLVLVPSLQEAFGFDPPRDGPWKHLWSHLYLAAFVITAAAAMGAQMSPFCLASNQITFKETPWATAQRYDWNEVAGMQSGCSKAPKDSFNLYYDLIMVDGRAVNLAASVPDFEPGYESMRQAFAAIGHHPPLNSQDVHLDCGYRNVRLLTQQL